VKSGGLRVRLVVLDGGERLPILIAADGVPLFRPTAWSVAMRRAVNAAAATILSDLIALKLLYLWADREGILLEERMLDGRYLSPSEINLLARVTRYRLDRLSGTVEQLGAPYRPVSLEHHRQRSPVPAPEVDPQTAATRLRTISGYLRWLTQDGLSGTARDVMEERTRARDAMLDSLAAQTPKARGYNVVGHREGPPEPLLDRLLAVVEPGAEENPWDDLGLRIRNRLLVHFIYGLGIRRGEALGIKITNIDFRQNRVLVARAADDPEDPRRYQPLTKTRDRWLPIKDALAAMTQDYVTHVRAKFPQARRHPFLFVSHQGGAPLALVSANKVFRTLRERVDGLPKNLSPHLLRYAWNDAFSAIADKRGTALATEEKVRSYLMGWSPTSKTAASYTRRHVREKAEELSLQHQANLMEAAAGAAG
jgi:integrase